MSGSEPDRQGAAGHQGNQDRGGTRPRRDGRRRREHRRALLRPHALAQLAKHGLLDLTVKAQGDTEIDAHHTVEDTALTLGQALREALGDKAGITRFGDAVVPLDETLASAALDLSGRPYCVHSEPDGMAPLIGTYDTTLTRHFFESLTASAGICLHLSVTGRNPHHLVEAQFKAVARALRTAAAPDPRSPGVPSTKGVL